MTPWAVLPLGAMALMRPPPLAPTRHAVGLIRHRVSLSSIACVLSDEERGISSSRGVGTRNKQQHLEEQLRLEATDCHPDEAGPSLPTASPHDASAAGAEQPQAGSRMEGALLMLAVAMLWGSNFPAVKATMEAGVAAPIAAAARFSIAAVALLPLMRGDGESDEPLPPGLVKGGLECGGWLALGYISQALALQNLPAGAVAFLASLQVVFVPLVLTFTGSAFTPRLALAAALCVGGVGLLESGGIGTATVVPTVVAMGPLAAVKGGASAAATAAAAAAAAAAEQAAQQQEQVAAAAAEAASGPDLTATLLALLQPVGFGTSYLRIEALLKEYPTAGLQLSSLQLTSNALIALAWCALDALVFSSGGDAASAAGGFDLSALQQPAVVGGLLYTGLISTALTVLLQTRALGMLPATDSSVIVATEPLWAAGLASVLLSETLDKDAQIGGAMILAGCLANTLLPEQLLVEAAAEAAEGDSLPSE